MSCTLSGLQGSRVPTCCSANEAHNHVHDGNWTPETTPHVVWVGSGHGEALLMGVGRLSGLMESSFHRS